MSLLQVLQENGAIGATYRNDGVDHFPELSLTECTYGLSIMIAESCAEESTLQNDTTMVLVEAAVAGDMENVIAISENAAKSLKERIVAFYNRVKAFIKSIIEKIKQWFTAATKSNQILVDKYGKDVKNKDLKDFTFTGYPFINNISEIGNSDLNISEIEDALKVADSDTTSLKIAVDNGWLNSDKAKAKEYEDAIKQLDKNLSDKKGFKLTTYRELIKNGSSLSSADDFKSYMFKTVRGGKDTKIEMKVGKDFTADAIIARMSKSDEIAPLIASYNKYSEVVEKLQAKIVQSIEDTGKLLSTLDTLDKAEDREKARNILNASLEIIKKSQEFAAARIACVNDVKNEITQGYKERSAQDKTMFMKMLQYKTPKNKNNSVEEDFMLSDIEFGIEI